MLRQFRPLVEGNDAIPVIRSVHLVHLKGKVAKANTGNTDVTRLPVRVTPGEILQRVSRPKAAPFKDQLHCFEVSVVMEVVGLRITLCH